MISAVNVVFSLSLVTQVYHGFKEKAGPVRLFTSVPTFLGLYVMAGAFYSLNLYFSSALSTLSGTFWLILFIQRLIYEGSKK